jgi:hypothetical protein
MREKEIEQKIHPDGKAGGRSGSEVRFAGHERHAGSHRTFTGWLQAFVEVKSPGKAPRPLQEASHRMLRKLGLRFLCWTTPNRLEGFLMKYEPHNYQTYAINYIETPQSRQSCWIWALAKQASH